MASFGAALVAVANIITIYTDHWPHRVASVSLELSTFHRAGVPRQIPQPLNGLPYAHEVVNPVSTSSVLEVSSGNWLIMGTGTDGLLVGSPSCIRRSVTAQFQQCNMLGVNA